MTQSYLGTSMETILCFGDSITQHGYDTTHSGWVSSLSNAYARRFTVLNAGFSGFSSDQALEVLPRIMPPPSVNRIRLLLVFFGANDARLPGTGTDWSPEQYVPEVEYKENLSAIVTHPKVKEHDTKVLLITPPPICEHVLMKNDGCLRRKADVASRYAQVVRDVSAETGLPHLDLWRAFMENIGWNGKEPLPGSLEVEKNKMLGNLLFDGLHPGKDGNKLIFDALVKKIGDEWPEMAPSEDLSLFAIPAWWDRKTWGHLFEARERKVKDMEAAGRI